MKLAHMLKKNLSFILIFTVIFSQSLPPKEAQAAIPITAPSAILMDFTSHRILYSKTPNLRRAPASTTKLLTSLVVAETMDLDKTVIIPGSVRKVEPSKVWLKPGERYRVRDLIRALLINSANDAADVLSYYAGNGSRARFAQMMNEKARAIGCRDSNFVNASGLPASNQYSTAYDMALIMSEFQKSPFLVKTLATPRTKIQSLGGRNINLKNHNKMLFRGHKEIVGKTGWTRTAKHCFVGQINLYNRTVFISMLGSHRLWKDVKALFDFQFGSSFKKKANERRWGAKAREIQVALKNAGFYTGEITGDFNPATIQAIKQFQKNNRMKADGVVGSKTWRKLRSFA